jgi:hypothetical protein
VPVIAQVHPEPARPRAIEAAILHLDRRVVGVDHLRLQHVLRHQRVERLQ